MIYIKEDTPIKMTGTTSLFLSFPYNELIINKIKTEPLYIFHKDIKLWELPLTSLSSLLDNLTYLDDIKLILKKEKIKENKFKPKLKYKTNSFKHQIESVEYGLNNNSWLLLDAPGLGKSKSIINLAEELKEQKGLKHCLIICGVASLRSNWKLEIDKHSNLSYRVLGERISKTGRISYTTIDERADELRKGVDEFFIIVNIESFRNKKKKYIITKGPNKGKEKEIIGCPLLEAFESTSEPIDMVVVDEVHKCKDSRSQQGSNLLKLDALYKIAATGTLLLNSPLDSYVPLKWIGKEHSNLSTFENYYCKYGGFGGHQVIGYKNLSLLKEEIDECSLRRTKDLLDLPPKNIIKEIINMNQDQEDFYINVIKGIKEECDKIELNANNTLALTTRLRQASTLPSILTTQNISSAKLDRCVDLVEQLVSQKEKVVIMNSFKETVNELVKRLKDYNPLVCTGDSKAAEIEKNKDLFQKDDEHYVMICTWQKMGTGHTLNRASYMIFTDTPYTEALFTQACDRIHRIGSKETVFIYNLINECTIDERVAELVEKKKALSDYVVDDIVDESTVDILRKYIQDL